MPSTLHRTLFLSLCILSKTIIASAKTDGAASIGDTVAVATVVDPQTIQSQPDTNIATKAESQTSVQNAISPETANIPPIATASKAVAQKKMNPQTTESTNGPQQTTEQSVQKPKQSNGVQPGTTESKPVQNAKEKGYSRKTPSGKTVTA